MARLLRRITRGGQCVNDTMDDHVHCNANENMSELSGAYLSDNNTLILVCQNTIHMVTLESVRHIDIGPFMWLTSAILPLCLRNKWMVIAAETLTFPRTTAVYKINLQTGVMRPLFVSNDYPNDCVFGGLNSIPHHPHLAAIYINTDDSSDIVICDVTKDHVSSEQFCLCTATLDHGRIETVRWSPCADLVVLEFTDLTIQICACDFEKKASTLLAEFKCSPCHNIQWSPDGTQLAILCCLNRLQIFDMRDPHSPTECASFEVPRAIDLWHQNNRLLLVLETNNIVSVDGKCKLQTIFACPPDTQVIAISSDGKRVFTNRMEEWLLCPGQQWNEYTHAYYAQLCPCLADRAFALFCVCARLTNLPFEVLCMIVSFCTNM